MSCPFLTSSLILTLPPNLQTAVGVAPLRFQSLISLRLVYVWLGVFSGLGCRLGVFLGGGAVCVRCFGVDGLVSSG